MIARRLLFTATTTHRVFTRFARFIVILLVALALRTVVLPSTVLAQDPSSTAPSPAVILIERPYAVSEFALDDANGQQMLNRALLAYTQRPTPAEAWLALGITPKDVVGIKISSGNGTALTATKRPLVSAIIQGLVSAGVPASNIIIWDRNPKHMRLAGYVPDGNKNSVNYRSVFGTGYTREAPYMFEVPGTLVPGDADFRGAPVNLMEEAMKVGEPDGGRVERSGSQQISNKSYFARLVTTTCTKIINIPALSDSPNYGINGCMATLALGSVDNYRRFGGGESQWGTPAIAEILSKDVLRKKVVLHILDATVAQYAGGPDFNPRNTAPFGAIYLGRDPVAIDTLALERAEQQRKEHKIVPIDKAGSHVKAGEMYNLGTADLKKIKVYKID
ncbi:MAG: DUF362 domain-containing protein [Candidatus Methylacidiphilales bacterium]